MLKAITPPTTSNLMAPATVQAALGLPDSELVNLTRQVKAVSGLVAGYLRFVPGYGVWEEAVAWARGPVLDLSARPAWAVSEVLDWRGTVVVAAAYRLERGQFGESTLTRMGSWELYDGADPYRYQNLAGGTTSFPLVVSGSGTDSLPDWTVRYTAGWWLEEMSGEPPVGVERLPAVIEEEFLDLIQWKRLRGGLPAGIRTMKNEGMDVEFSSPDRGIDLASGLPEELTTALSLYRRVA